LSGDGEEISVAPEPGVTMIDRDRAREIAHRLFADPEQARYGPIELIDGPDERIPGLLFVFLGEHGDHGAVTLQLFGGLGAVGGQLWEREVDALTRASRRDHVALPTVYYGGYDDTDDVGFVVTKSSGAPLGEDLEPFRDDPRWALRCLSLLVDALRHIHACGVVHRNLSPATLAWTPHPSLPSEEYVALCRFEFSALLSNLLRVRPEHDETGLRGLLAAQPPESLACMAPERLTTVFPGASWEPAEDPRSDVFALGVVAWQWFVEPLPARLLKAVFADGAIDEDARLLLHRHLIQALDESSSLPRELRRVLRSMLAWELRNRFTSAEVAAHLARHFESISREIAVDAAEGEGGVERTWIISGTSHEFADLKKWGWIESDPSLDADGLKSFLEADLTGGVLVYEPRGFEPYDRGVHRAGNLKAKMRRAKWVLLGRLGAYFCSPWETSGRRSTKLPWTLHIRYTLKREYESARELEERLFQRRLPTLRFVGHDSALLRDIPANRDRWPPWTPMLESVEAEPARPAWYGHWRDATAFLLEWHAAELRTRRYPYEVVKGSAASGDVTIELDWQRWERRKDDDPSPLVRLLLRDDRRVPGFVPFFDTLQDRGQSGRVVWRRDESGRPGRRLEDGGVGYVLDPVHSYAIRIRTAPGSPDMPRLGWLEPADDRGTWSALSRQRDARHRLLDNPALLDQLNNPRSAITLRRDWADHAAGPLDPDSRAAKVVPRMLRVQPFFALQGPPGTGKSTVTSLVIAALLEAMPGARVLVAAQSHAALDDLGRKVTSRLGPGTEVQSIRVATRDDQVHKSMRRYLLDRQAAQRVREIERRALELSADPELSGAVRGLVGRWGHEVGRAVHEIEDRLRRGANLVFSTCGSATPERLAVESAYDLFDYVFVEEAAKAWPTELAIPLVVGLRWILVGDHQQLSAYRREDASRLLADCETSAAPSLQEQAARRDEYEEVFDFFGGFFEAEAHDAIDRLDMQFRMRKPIAEIVNRAFYGKRLRTSPKTEVPHGFDRPSFVQGRALVWIDTQGLAGFDEQRRWKNKGEAGLVRRLLEAMSFDGGAGRQGVLDQAVDADEAPLAVLSPYRQQNKLLAEVLPEAYASSIHTVDSFQGGQALVVVASLVRTNDQSAEDPLLAIGHLAKEDRVNVMLSRARRLMVLVGDLRHFEASQTVFWPQICGTVRELGTIVPAATLLGSEP